MLLVRAAHATALGFMATVGRLKFGSSITPRKHKWLLTLFAAFFILGYPWLFALWLNALAAYCVQGRIVAGDGFLVLLPTSTTNPKPTRRDIIIGAVSGLVLLLALLGAACAAIALRITPVREGAAISLASAVCSILVRPRRDDYTLPSGSTLVGGLVPTDKSFRKTAVTVAPAWLAQQPGPVSWVADEGLKLFYETILNRWCVQGVLVNPGRRGFWGLICPPRYLFTKP